MRVSAFGVLTPGEKRHAVMVEDSRNNVMETYSNSNFMDFWGTMANVERTYELDKRGFVVADPFQMPQVYGTLLDLDATIAAVEAEALDVLRPLLDERSRADYEQGPRLSHFQCGSLRHQPPRPEEDDMTIFHIANAAAPASIFEDPAYLPQCFRDLLDGATPSGRWNWKPTCC